MVTTRSAEKRITTNGKVEDLALRSKPDGIDDISAASTGDQSPTPTSSRKRTKIFVNVPQPRKRTRASYDGTEESDIPRSTLGPDVSVTEPSDPPTEIPDSQESPMKLKPEESIRGQSEFIDVAAKASDLDLSATSNQEGGNAEEAKVDSTLNLEAPTSLSDNQHTRFDSEEPPGDQLGPVGDGSPKDFDADTGGSEDEDGAPEVISFNQRPAGRLIPASRKPTRKKTIKLLLSQVTKQPEIENMNNFAGSEEGVSNIVPTPLGHSAAAPNIHTTEQPEELAAATESDDSAQQPFMTARTHRHKDVFGPPENGGSYLISPTLPEPGHTQPAHGLLSIPDGVTKPATFPSTDLHVASLAGPRQRPTQSGANAAHLPPKARGTVEDFRQQLLLSRVEKDARSGRDRKFRLQEDWATKKRKFVVGC